MQLQVLAYGSAASLQASWLTWMPIAICWSHFCLSNGVSSVHSAVLMTLSCHTTATRYLCKILGWVVWLCGLLLRFCFVHVCIKRPLTAMLAPVLAIFLCHAFQVSLDTGLITCLVQLAVSIFCFLVHIVCGLSCIGSVCVELPGVQLHPDVDGGSHCCTSHAGSSAETEHNPCACDSHNSHVAVLHFCYSCCRLCFNVVNIFWKPASSVVLLLLCLRLQSLFGIETCAWQSVVHSALTAALLGYLLAVPITNSCLLIYLAYKETKLQSYLVQSTYHNLCGTHTWQIFVRMLWTSCCAQAELCVVAGNLMCKAALSSCIGLPRCCMSALQIVSSRNQNMAKEKSQVAGL